MLISPFIFVSSIPTLVPSIIFGILFLFASSLHLYRITQNRRRVYILLFLFSFLRTVLFVVRIAWSQDQSSVNLAITSGTFTSGAFFIIILAIYNLLEDWILTLTNTLQIAENNSNTPRRLAKLTNYEQYILYTIECLLPVFSTLFVIGIIKEFDHDDVISDDSDSSITEGETIIKFSVISFLVSVTVYMILVTYFALKYSNKPIHTQLKVLVLYIVGALLLIELVYTTFMIFAPSTDKINKYSWIFYVFEPLPEVLVVVILGGVILGEWFFEEEDTELVDSIKTGSIGSIGNGNASV
ncbi:hypothetical protein C1645_771199 [Glomus cerebriforme]|uniref:THH1/TOM1/TOM3 domain-containing protein n=1 Tax=Glomus cerebriforme TaxID=658196 RepID=A0A397T4C6_9GLOM|nr:hypothetical protein C1645_771199 [Glomus cerebriforme]